MSISEIVKKVNSLKVSELRALLKKEKVMGECASSTDCVLARYILKKTRKNAVVNGELTASPAEGWQVQQNGKAFPLSPSVGRFLMRFDEGNYPELIESSL